MKCAHCNRKLGRRPQYLEQVCWTKQRPTGGPNRHGLKPTGRYLCDECGTYLWTFNEMRPAVDEGQMSLGDER